MKLEQIRKNWIAPECKDIQAGIQMWDSASSDYRKSPIPDWETDDFLKLVNDSMEISKDMKALDIGCGAGLYTIAFAGKVNKVVGIDFSPSMIRIAKEKTKDNNSQNVEFLRKDWSAFDIEKANFKNAFDIVFAHMSPAICSAATLEKLIACSKKHCFFIKPTIRNGSIFNEVERLAGSRQNANGCDESISYAFGLIWQLGYKPLVSYHDEIWNFEKSLEEAYTWYLGRVRTYKKLTESEETKLKEYLDSIAVDGRIKEAITTTIASMYWQI